MKSRWSLLLVFVFCSILSTTLSVPTLNTDVEGTSGDGYISEDDVGTAFDVKSAEDVGANTAGWTTFCIHEKWWGDEIWEVCVSGEIIAWTQIHIGIWSGVVYDLSSGTRVSWSQSVSDALPRDISGNLVVCENYQTSLENRHIVIYDASTDTRYEVGKGSEVTIDGTHIAYRRAGDIYMYDLLSLEETRITDSTATESAPDISGDKIVYRKSQEGGKWSVCLYDGSSKSETVLATYQFEWAYPVIDGNRVVWCDSRHGGYDIYIYNIATEEVSPLCVEAGYQFCPSISGDLATWIDGRNYASIGWEICIHNLTSHEETLMPAWVPWCGECLSQHAVSNNGRVAWSDRGTHARSAGVYVTVPEVIFSDFFVETDKDSYATGEVAYIFGGVTFETSTSGMLNIAVLDSSPPYELIHSVCSQPFDANEGERLDFADLNDGDPLGWNTSTKDGTFKIRATLQMVSPYRGNITKDSGVFDVSIVVAVTSINVFTDSSLYDVFDTVYVSGDITTNGEVSNANVQIDVIRASDGSTVTTLLQNTGVYFSENVPQTLKQINYGSDVTWTPEEPGDYKIEVCVSGGSPQLQGRTEQSETFTVRTEGNQPPSLSNGYVDPSSGTTSTTFNYYVTYSDPEGAAPTTKCIYVDDTPHSMTYVSGSYTSGALFRYQTTLSAGDHDYYFEFSDGANTVRLPQSGTYSGPTVNGVPTFSDLKELFIHDGSFDALIVYGETQPHTLWGSRTIDVVGGTSVATAFAVWADDASPNNWLDMEVYDDAAEEFLPEFRGPLIAVGGPCVNWAFWHYNHYIPHEPSDVSPLLVYFRWIGGTFPVGEPSIWTTTSNSYTEEWVIEDGQRTLHTYSVVELYWDPDYDRPVLLVAGICGPGTRAAAEWLADRMLDGSILAEECTAFVLRVSVRDGGVVDVTVAERI